MANINAGDTAFLKTSREMVFVLEINDNNATVRRPIRSDLGQISHVVETFTIAELTNKQALLAEEMADRAELQKAVLGMKAAEDAPEHEFNA